MRDVEPMNNINWNIPQLVGQAGMVLANKPLPVPTDIQPTSRFTINDRGMDFSNFTLDTLASRAWDSNSGATMKDRDYAMRGFIHALTKEGYSLEDSMIIASQWAQESNWGSKPSGKNNYFGIKGDPSKGNGSYVMTTENDGLGHKRQEYFRNYASVAEGIKDRYDLLQQKYPKYSQAKDLIEKIEHLDTYATDPFYRAKLLENLYQNGGLYGNEEILNAIAHYATNPRREGIQWTKELEAELQSNKNKYAKQLMKNSSKSLAKRGD